MSDCWRFGEFELQVLRVEIAEMEAFYGCKAKWLIRMATHTHNGRPYEEMIVDLGREGVSIVNMNEIVHGCGKADCIRKMFRRNFRKYLTGTAL